MPPPAFAALLCCLLCFFHTACGLVDYKHASPEQAFRSERDGLRVSCLATLSTIRLLSDLPSCTPGAHDRRHVLACGQPDVEAGANDSVPVHCRVFDIFGLRADLGLVVSHRKFSRTGGPGEEG